MTGVDAPARRLFLCSLGLGALPAFLERASAGGACAYVPTAANAVPGAFWLDEVEADLERCGLRLVRLDLDEPTSDVEGDLGRADVVFVGGGDPFHLLAAARRSGFDAAAAAFVSSGRPYVGMSAGAILVGPTLEPVTLTSPHRPAAGQPLDGVGLVEQVVLPHHDREGRAERHRVALERFGGSVTLVPLRDDEALVVDGGAAAVVPSP